MKRVLRVLVFLGSATVTLAQWVPPDPEPRNISIQTTGGVAYLKFTYESTCPQELVKAPPTRMGTNVYQQVFLWNASRACPAVFPPIVEVHQATLVLGAFEPGKYTCHLSITSDGLPWPPRSISVSFTVGPDRTMTLLSFGGPSIAFRVAGTSNITYRVLSSATLTDWTGLHTNENAPFTIT